MKNIISYIMEQKKAVLAIVLLLVIQAYCDLALPQYTSDIVDVGISSSGVDNVYPECIRENTLTTVKAFLFGKDLDAIEKNYKKIDYKSMSDSKQKEYRDKYPIIMKESLYEWVGDEQIEKEHKGAFNKACLMLMMSSEDKQMDWNKILAMPEDARRQMLDKVDKQFQSLDDDMIDGMVYKFVKSEYEAIGVDLEEMQNHFILVAGAKMLALSLLSVLVTIFVSFLAAKAAASIGKNLRSRVFRKVVSFSGAEMEHFSTASLITRSTNDVQQIQMVTTFLLRMVLYAPILGIGGILKVLGTNTSLAWIIAVAIGTIVVLVVSLFGVVLPKFKIMQSLVDRLNLVTREILTGIPVIRAFSTEKFEEKRFERANKDLTKTQLFTTRAMSIMMPTMMFLINVVSIAIVWFASHKIDAGSLQVGQMIALITYSMQIIMAFLMITMVSIMLPRAGVAANRIHEVMTTPLSLKDPETSKSIDSFRKKGVVEFRDVSFKYPGADGYSLEHISFQAKQGETTAFIGSTGSGKSTLVNLIPRFYDVTEGAVLVDGVDVREMKQKELRSKLGFVPQKAVLFSGTIASNIAYGRENAEECDIEKAAAIAQSTDFIEEKEDKYESTIAQGGGNVSGGQKQRLSIARAIANNPEILVFDDSFSALDFKTDVALRKALHEEVEDTTILVVAQRISTIMHAEQIVVLDEGKVVGIGTHEELLKNCPVYYEIATSQLSAEELNSHLQADRRNE